MHSAVRCDLESPDNSFNTSSPVAYLVCICGCVIFFSRSFHLWQFVTATALGSDFKNVSVKSLQCCNCFVWGKTPSALFYVVILEEAPFYPPTTPEKSSWSLLVSLRGWRFGEGIRRFIATVRRLAAVLRFRRSEKRFGCAQFHLLGRRGLLG